MPNAHPTLRRIVASMHARPWLTLTLAGAYWSAVVLWHQQAAEFSLWLFGSWTKVTVEARSKYDTLMAAVGAVLLIGYLWIVAQSVRRGPARAAKLAYITATTAAAIAAFCTLVIMSIEVVHFPQYAILAVLLFPWTASFGATVFWTALLGALDEAYQFGVLPRDASAFYYDFNDVVLNTIGAAFGVVLVRCLDLGLRPVAWAGRAVAVTAGSILMLGFSLWLVGVLRLHPPADGGSTVILLNEKPPTEGFWTLGVPAVKFHLLQPIAGVSVLGLLLIAAMSIREPAQDAEENSA